MKIQSVGFAYYLYESRLLTAKTTPESGVPLLMVGLISLFVRLTLGKEREKNSEIVSNNTFNFCQQFVNYCFKREASVCQ